MKNFLIELTLKAIICALIVAIAVVAVNLNKKACAAEQSVMLDYNFYTTHMSNYDGYNNDNDQIAIEYKFDDWYINGSKFTNSFYIQSYSLGFGYNLLNAHNFDLDILAGAMTGYESTEPYMLCNGNICYYFAPRLSYSINLSKAFTIKPSVKISGPAVVLSAGAEYRF